MKISFTISENGSERSIEAESGVLLSDALRQNHCDINMPCAGKGICKKCAVLVDGETHLACQTKISDGMRTVLYAHADYTSIASGGKPGTQPQEPMYSRRGLSVDIGTTTVCVSLLDSSGTARTATRKNPQTGFGADVISRIEKALAGGLEALAGCIRAVLADMISELCAREEIQSESIDAAVITGNTAMLYLLTGRNPETLSRAPFQADNLFGEYLDAGALGLPLDANARIYLPRCASAFVGGDVTTAIIASGMLDRSETSMLVDIGTNGEIALWRQGRLDCCSTAAGPAFEGAGIAFGTYGVNGAIDRVRLQDGRLRCSTIGAGAPSGICGSGIVDALAVMLELGAIDETGAFADESGFMELQNGIGISASDVRRLQLAKGSIRAGIETLLQISGVEKREVETLYIAGGFGSHIDLKNAAAIGLIPEELLPRAKVIGNAAHTGATMLLCEKALAEASEGLMLQSHTVALDANPVFADNYMTYMLFE